MDLSTSYLDFDLAHPIVPGACPMANDIDMVRRLEDAGAPMITLTSLFEEELRRESMATAYAMDSIKGHFAEALSYLPEPDEFSIGPEEYLDRVHAVKRAIHVPVVASLNGTSLGGWLEYAKLIEDAGADALELNIYRVSSDPERSSGQIEDESVAVVKTVCDALSIPVAVKLSPFYTSLPHFCQRLSLAGADALIIFNRFYQPDIDAQTLDLVQSISLSTSDELQLRLRWLAILSGRINADLAVTGGVHTAMDVLKSVMCGADICQMASALLMHGPQHLTLVRDALAQWLIDHEYDSLQQAHCSMNLQHIPHPDALMRANYLHILRSWSATADNPQVEI